MKLIPVIPALHIRLGSCFKLSLKLFNDLILLRKPFLETEKPCAWTPVLVRCSAMAHLDAMLVLVHGDGHDIYSINDAEI
jgi:hypothetical protein